MRVSSFLLNLVPVIVFSSTGRRFMLTTIHTISINVHVNVVVYGGQEYILIIHNLAIQCIGCV